MKKVRIVPMAAEHLNEVAALELACFSRPWSRQMLAEELDNQCAAFLVALEPETDKVIGYAGLRYIELSISSPICNSSGAMVAVLSIITGSALLAPAQYAAMALVCVGVIGLGIVEAREDDELRLARQEAGNYKYAKSVLALVLPILYCVLDALGTFADSKVLETLNEDSANCAYELTFLAAGIACFVYVVLIRRQKLVPKREGPKYLGALCETAGQFAYIYALADTEHVALAAPIISAYCVLSVVWSRIFLKEKLSWKHYLMIALVVAGIVILGIYDE